MITSIIIYNYQKTSFTLVKQRADWQQGYLPSEQIEGLRAEQFSASVLECQAMGPGLDQGNLHGLTHIQCPKKVKGQFTIFQIIEHHASLKDVTVLKLIT